MKHVEADALEKLAHYLETKADFDSRTMLGLAAEARALIASAQEEPGLREAKHKLKTQIGAECARWAARQAIGMAQLTLVETLYLIIDAFEPSLFAPAAPDALRKALEKYGTHLSRCKKDYGVACTCGFDAALRRKEGEG